MRKLFDKLMFRLGYYPRSRVEGAMLILNKEKFDIAVIQDQAMVSDYQLTEMQSSLEVYEKHAKESMIHRVATKITDMAEWHYDAPAEDHWHRFRIRIWVAIRKK